MRAPPAGGPHYDFKPALETKKYKLGEALSMKLLMKICLSVVITTLIISCNTDSDDKSIQETTIVDSTGEVVATKGQPSRLISLGPSNTEILFALGAGDMVVGVDDFSDHPSETKTVAKVGAPFPSFDLERIVSLKPDLVVSTELAEFNATLKGLTIPVYVSNPKNIEEVIKTIDDIGHLVGLHDNATTLSSQIRSRMSAVKSLTSDIVPTTVFYEVDASDPTRPYTVGGPSFVNDIINMSGGMNIFQDIDIAYPQVGLEDVVARNPSVILLANAYAPMNPQSVETAATRPGWNSITAVKNNSIIPVNPDLFSRPGPRLIEGIEYLAKLLHPNLFLNSES